MKKILYLLLLLPIVTFCQKKKKVSKKASDISYSMPEESETHEATWLQWPHEYQYEDVYSDRLNDTWIAMTEALIGSEKVNIITYNEDEKEKIEEMLVEAEVSLDNINFYIHATDDVWVRDNGPIFVRDNSGKIVIQDWGFNGWGKKAAYNNCNSIPSKLAEDLNIESINLNSLFINEGGSVEVDGNGTMLACKSSILNKNRNPEMTQSNAEAIFKKYLGVSNFIWLNGKAGLEITDMHIDGFARFANSKTIVTMSEDDLIEWQVPTEDIDILLNAKNIKGEHYKIIELPLTKEDVITEYGKNLEYKGSYVNYYIANKVVLVPNYNDENDAIANAIIQKLYPTRTVISIDVRNLYANGGMIHCVTQQQPK